MRFAFFAFAALFLALNINSASANNQIQFFPPSSGTCSDGSEVRAIGWDGASSTVCISGAQLVALNLPDCQDGQVLVYRAFGRVPVGESTSNSSGFFCETMSTSTVENSDKCEDCASRPPTCTDSQQLKWKDNAWACVGQPRLKCTPRYATTAIKGACGMTSEVRCNPGEFALNGGMIVSNASGQTSAPIFGADGNAIGWGISVLNDGTNPCEINQPIADGTVAVSENGKPPRFFVGNGAFIWGQAVATCCRYE